MIRLLCLLKKVEHKLHKKTFHFRSTLIHRHKVR